MKKRYKNGRLIIYLEYILVFCGAFIVLDSLFGLGIIALFLNIIYGPRSKKSQKKLREEYESNLDECNKLKDSNYLTLCKARLREIDIEEMIKEIYLEIKKVCKDAMENKEENILLEDGRNYHFIRGNKGYVDVTNLSDEIREANDVHEVLDSYSRKLIRR